MNALHKFLIFQLLASLRRNADGSEIINGRKASENSMKYMAAVYSNTQLECGGFLIRDNFVVTAAHCFKDDLTHVVLGTHNLKSGDGKKIEIEKAIKHESYRNVAGGFDIMLLKLKLSEKDELGDKVKAIHLSTTEMKPEKCQVAGWGAIETGGHVVDDLRVVDVSIINLTACKEIWRDLPDNVTCAGGYHTEKGFCQGDSGGPLVCNGVAAGVASFNNNGRCHYPDVPNVYTDVSKYLEWINDTIKDNK